MTDQDTPAPSVTADAEGRPALRPLVGLPQRRESRWGGPTLSFLAHALLVLLLFLPSFMQATIEVDDEGAGGPGPLQFRTPCVRHADAAWLPRVTKGMAGRAIFTNSGHGRA